MGNNFSINKKYYPFILPTAVFLIVVTLTLTVGTYVAGKLQEKIANISNFEESNKILEEKKTQLSTLDQAQLTKQVEAVVTAVPKDESALLLLASLRSLAVKKNLTVSDFNLLSDPSKVEGVKVVKVDISVSGNLSSILSFVDSIKNSSPLMRISKFGFSVNNENVLASLTVNSYWGPLPTVLSEADKPLQPLRQSEQQLLSRLSGLKKPDGLNYGVLQPQGRENPFVY